MAFRRTMTQVEGATEAWMKDRNQDVLDITPMDTGDLRESQYLVKTVVMNGFTIETGFTASYAPIVHEWPSDTNWTTPGTDSKYLQQPYYSQAMSLPRFIQYKVRI